MRASLLGEGGEILLAGFERVHFRSGSAFRIHCEPDRPDDDADHAGSDVLRDLGVVLFGEFLGLEIVGFDLSADHRAIALRILRLDDGDRMRVASGTSGQRKNKGQRHQPKLPAIHGRNPQPQAKSNVREMFYATGSRITTIYLKVAGICSPRALAIYGPKIGQWTRSLMRAR